MTIGASVAEQVMAAEQRRCAAMLANEPAELDAVLDERLCFSHATGAIDDKPAYLAKMATGRIDYLSINWTDQRIIALADDTALLTGVMTSVVRVEGVEKQLDNRVLAAWAASGDVWRMVAFQSTPIKR